MSASSTSGHDGHQHLVGVYGDSVFSGGIAQALQLEPVILVRLEAGLAIIAPLDDVAQGSRVKKVVVNGPCASLFAHSVRLNLRFGSHISSSFYSDLELQGRHAPIVHYGLPDRLIQHGTREEMLADAGLTKKDLLEFIRRHASGLVKVSAPGLIAL